MGFIGRPHLNARLHPLGRGDDAEHSPPDWRVLDWPHHNEPEIVAALRRGTGLHLSNDGSEAAALGDAGKVRFEEVKATSPSPIPLEQP